MEEQISTGDTAVPGTGGSTATQVKQLQVNRLHGNRKHGIPGTRGTGGTTNTGGATSSANTESTGTGTTLSVELHQVTIEPLQHPSSTFTGMAGTATTSQVVQLLAVVVPAPREPEARDSQARGTGGTTSSGGSTGSSGNQLMGLPARGTGGTTSTGETAGTPGTGGSTATGGTTNTGGATSSANTESTGTGTTSSGGTTSSDHRTATTSSTFTGTAGTATTSSGGTTSSSGSTGSMGTRARDAPGTIEERIKLILFVQNFHRSLHQREQHPPGDTAGTLVLRKFLLLPGGTTNTGDATSVPARIHRNRHYFIWWNFTTSDQNRYNILHVYWNGEALQLRLQFRIQWNRKHGISRDSRNSEGSTGSMQFMNTQGSVTELPKKFSTPVNIGLDLDVYLNIPPNISNTTESLPDLSMNSISVEVMND
ncbi:hypothetical protein TNIN_366411 [Trichonephila inaurata madagascariensis]|uniref:Uncharacterized protein n=1 Tax=Trichonephila inaurata madagascariensis TaxID=2747483 RepID=A0A8X7C2G4_9ARAC|nr:hypothetical protein TNIN_366411 [Trichonephila inaurata madagascariensis]